MCCCMSTANGWNGTRLTDRGGLMKKSRILFLCFGKKPCCTTAWRVRDPGWQACIEELEDAWKQLFRVYGLGLWLFV